MGIAPQEDIPLYQFRRMLPVREGDNPIVQGIKNRYGARLTMGSDPEFFVTHDGSRFPVPAFDYLPGKKTPNNGWFWDGFQAETVIPVPPLDYQRSCHIQMAN